MNSPIQIAARAENFVKNGCEYTFEHGEKNNCGVDTIMSFGAVEWIIEIENPMGGYGMYCACWFLDLGDDYIGFVQLYEHSRGGHTDPTLTIITKEGTLIGSHLQYAGQMDEIAYSETKIWLLHRDTRVLNEDVKSNIPKPILLELELATSAVLSHKELALPSTNETAYHPAYNSLQTADSFKFSVKFQLINKIVYLAYTSRDQEITKLMNNQPLAIPLIDFL